MHSDNTERDELMDHRKHCRVAVYLSPEEMDALVSLVLTAPVSNELTEEIATNLLRRLAEAQREHAKPRVQSVHEVAA